MNDVTPRRAPCMQSHGARGAIETGALDGSNQPLGTPRALHLSVCNVCVAGSWQEICSVAVRATWSTPIDV